MSAYEDLRRELCTLLHLPDGEQKDTDIVVGVSMLLADKNLFREDADRYRQQLASPIPGDLVGSLLTEVHAEVSSAVAKFAPFNSAHEGWAVLREEVDEMWDEVKRYDVARAREEAVQVAAMAVRFLLDCTP